MLSCEMSLSDNDSAPVVDVSLINDQIQKGYDLFENMSPDLINILCVYDIIVKEDETSSVIAAKSFLQKCQLILASLKTEV